MSEIVDGTPVQLRRSAAELAVHEMLSVPDGVYGSPVDHFEIDQCEAHQNSGDGGLRTRHAVRQ